MKNIFNLIFLIVGLQTIAQSTVEPNNSNLEWQQSYSNALKLSKREHKPLLIFFTGSDWCSPCKMLVNDLFNTAEFYNFATSKFIFYQADFPRNKDLVSNTQQIENSKLKLKYNIATFPTIVIINQKEQELGRKRGYNLMRETSYHYKFLIDILKN